MSWLPLTDYSLKHGVSISTLRRRIKTDDIKFRFDDGKYFILDEPVGTHQRVHRPSPIVSEQSLVGAKAAPSPAETTSTVLVSRQQVSALPNLAPNSPLNSTPNTSQSNEVVQSLLAEIKKAYALVLSEKEEQIMQLKEEVSDLKTLTRVLESELNKYRKSSQP